MSLNAFPKTLLNTYLFHFLNIFSVNQLEDGTDLPITNI